MAAHQASGPENLSQPDPAAKPRTAADRVVQMVLVGIALCFALMLALKFRQLGTSLDLDDAAYYYAAPAAGAGGALWAAFMRPAVRAMVCAYGLAVGIALVAVDVYAALTAKPPREIQRERYVADWMERGIPHDARSRLEVVRDLRRENVAAYPQLSPISLLEGADGGPLRSAINVAGKEVLPVSAAASNTVSVVCNESGKYLVYRSDEHGFHNPPGIWGREQVDLAVLGDSFAEGYCVPSDKNAVALMRSKHPATLNLGVGGHGPLLELATLTEYLPRVRPKVVLWFYFEGNDLPDLEIERRSPLLMRYLEDGFSQGLMSQQPVVDRAIRAYIDRRLAGGDLAGYTVRLAFTDFLYLRHLRDKLGRALGDDTPPGFSDPRNIELLGTVLEAAKRRTSAWSGTLVFVYLPGAPGHPTQSDQQWAKEQVLARARGLGVPVFDLSADFLAHPDPASMFVIPDLESHYDEDGYRYVAERVLGALPGALAAAQRRRLRALQ